MAGNGSQQRKIDFKIAVEDVKALATVLAMEAESILGRRTSRVLGALALFAVLVGLLVWYIAPSGAAEKQALVVTLAQILGGTALLSGLYFTWRTLQVNREGQITERFTRAIDQLGKVEDGKKLYEIRIGGIYALERIARESEEDYWPIMEVLTAYVRHNSHWPHGQIRSPQDVRELVEQERGLDVKEVLPDRPKPDIEAIMTVLRRRARSYGFGEPQPLNLSDTNLARVDLKGANLSYAYLPGAYLFAANLRQAILSNAKLWDAWLYGANLTGEASLIGADLTGAQLWQAELKGALLISAILKKAGFWRADLSEAKLGLANLEGADLRRADLSGANLSSAKNLDKARLQGAHLEGANLSFTKLTQEQLEETTGDKKTTRLPDGLEPPAHWGVKTDEQPEED